MSLENIVSNKKYLFLDRDGVINKRIVGGYITKWENFEFLPGVIEALIAFSNHFDRIFIVTNQQGIGKGLMSEADLLAIHKSLKKTIEEKGGRIDGIYHCPMLKDTDNNCRKPGTKMALWAQADFPEIEFKKSIMVGDTYTDMEFAKNAGMKAVLLINEFSNEQDKASSHTYINSLSDISNLLK